MSMDMGKAKCYNHNNEIMESIDKERIPMKTKIRTANEEIHGWAFPLIFIRVYAVFFIYQMITNGFSETLVFLLVLGLLFPIQYLKVIRRSFKFRQLHEHFVKEYKPERGRIYKITKELPKEGQENKIHYYLHIEILNSHGQLVRKVKSEAYYKPIHKYLASPEVDIYYDKQNNYFVVDGFQLKENENEPDIALESSNVYDEMVLPKRQYTLAEKIIWIGGSILITVQLILYFIWK